MLVSNGESTHEKLFTTENCTRWADKGVEKVCVYRKSGTSLATLVSRKIALKLMPWLLPCTIKPIGLTTYRVLQISQYLRRSTPS
jgi:hypothetical protein